jgi:hypothetical protein
MVLFSARAMLGFWEFICIFSEQCFDEEAFRSELLKPANTGETGNTRAAMRNNLITIISFL